MRNRTSGNDGNRETSDSGSRNAHSTDQRVVARALPTILTMGLAAIISHALARSTLPILLPAIESELLENYRQSGYLGSGNFFAYLVGVVVVTFIAGSVEPKQLLVGGISLATAGFAVLAVAGSLAILMVGQILAGLGSAGIWMSAPAIATGAVPAHRRGAVMGFLSSMMGLGILISGQGTNLARYLASDPDLWRPTWLGAAVFGVIIVGVAWSLTLPATSAVSGGISLIHLSKVPRWIALATAYWIFGIVVSAFAPFFGLLVKEQGYGPEHTTNLFSLLGLAAVLGAISLGWTSDRIGRKPILMLAMVGIGFASLLALIGREPFSSISIAIYGALSFTFPVLVAAYVRDYLESRSFSVALGALTIIYGTALTIGPTLAGLVADSSLGLEAAFVVFAVLSLVAAITVAVLNGRPSTPAAIT